MPYLEILHPRPGYHENNLADVQDDTVWWWLMVVWGVFLWWKNQISHHLMFFLHKPEAYVACAHETICGMDCQTSHTCHRCCAQRPCALSSRWYLEITWDFSLNETIQFLSNTLTIISQLQNTQSEFSRPISINSFLIASLFSKKKTVIFAVPFVSLGTFWPQLSYALPALASLHHHRFHKRPTW